MPKGSALGVVGRIGHRLNDSRILIMIWLLVEGGEGLIIRRLVQISKPNS